MKNLVIKRNNTMPQSSVAIKKCLNCGEKFIPHKYARPTQKCCSKVCAQQYRLKKNWDKPFKACVVCGKEFIPKDKRQILCLSKECKSVRNNELARLKRESKGIVYDTELKLINGVWKWVNKEGVVLES